MWSFWSDAAVGFNRQQFICLGTNASHENTMQHASASTHHPDAEVFLHFSQTLYGHVYARRSEKPPIRSLFHRPSPRFGTGTGFRLAPGLVPMFSPFSPGSGCAVPLTHTHTYTTVTQTRCCCCLSVKLRPLCLCREEEEEEEEGGPQQRAEIKSAVRLRHTAELLWTWLEKTASIWSLCLMLLGKIRAFKVGFSENGWGISQAFNFVCFMYLYFLLFWCYQ